MAKRKLVLIISSILVIVVAVIIILALYWRDKDVSFKEPPKLLFTIYGKKHTLSRPLNLAAARERIFVADSKNGQVQVFDSRGDSIFSFPAAKNKKSTDSYPVGITVDNGGKIYLSELRSQKLLVFSAAGDFISQFPHQNSKLLKKPLAVTFANNKLYLTDAGDQKIKIFSLRGKLLLEFGKAGTGKGEFAFPNGVAAAKDGTIFVSDSNNKRIQVFNSKGKFKSAFGKQTLALPRGIAIDWLERIHVVDTFGHKIIVFDKQQNLLFSYSAETTQSPNRELSLPAGIAIDNRMRRIYVSDRSNNSISVWGYQ